MQLFVYFRYMHDMDKPLGVEQDQLDDIVSTKSIASTCPECEQNINSTRYRWGQLTRVNSDSIYIFYKSYLCPILIKGAIHKPCSHFFDDYGPPPLPPT